ncbi:MAG: GrpB family protein [Pyrinomonadaceae bacterium]|nr:GrpB family protein [Pyrinomonadaceae bacterium]
MKDHKHQHPANSIDGGLAQPEEVVIVEYNPAWPARFEEEKARILNLIGSWVERVEHIGSTSVPGLGAKPIIDIMIGIRSLADAPECIRRLETIGYEYISKHEAMLPERRYFHKVTTYNTRTHHLHMVETTTTFWTRHLLFRDYLRSHPETARDYYRLKKELAARFRQDRDAYTDAKTSFIEQVVAQARKEAL